MDTLLIILSLILTCVGDKIPKICTSAPETGFFYYFAYGSNLLPERMHINCKTAVSCHEPAKLENYRLDFIMSSSVWNGAVATIVEDPDETVWGNLWQISFFESSKLDQQEGVSSGTYYPRQVNVTLESGLTIPARVYIGSQPPAEKVAPEDQPSERRPSRTYHQVILFGAIACRIPVIHIEYIQRFPHNGKIAPTSTRKSLEYPFYDETFSGPNSI